LVFGTIWRSIDEILNRFKKGLPVKSEHLSTKGLGMWIAVKKPHDGIKNAQSEAGKKLTANVFQSSFI